MSTGAISAPSDSIRPIVEVKGDTAIDTQALPVRVLIRDQYKPDGDYDANTMGVWKVRLIQQKAYNETVALTDYAEASNGEAQFSVDLSGVDTSSVRIAAEAVLESPVEGLQPHRVVYQTCLLDSASWWCHRCWRGGSQVVW
ncbi:Uncharacterised protein [Escherichia coli]|nr:Uncharacterised protein [Escherichia coli]